MNDDQVSEVIDEMERALQADDPAFVKRVHCTRRNDTINFVVVFMLLGLGAVLLTVGFATAAVIPWSAGGLALVAAVLVDDRHKRTLHDVDQG